MRGTVAAAALMLAATVAQAQTIPPARIAVLQAEDRRAPTAQDLATIRRGVASGDAQTVRIAIRALGRLERPPLIPDIVVALRHSIPEVRAEAANAVAQAAQGSPISPAALASAQNTLITRVKIEAEPAVRAALCEAIARLPYRAAADVERADAALVDAAEHDTITDRLGIAKGFEALARLHTAVRPPSDAAIAWLAAMVRSPDEHPEQDPLRDARIRRLAMEALIAAGRMDDATTARAARDPDAQVRRLAVRAAAASGTGAATLLAALDDESPIVRVEALRAGIGEPAAASASAEGQRVLDPFCAAVIRAADDRDTAVAVAALDQVPRCHDAPEAAALLGRIVNDLSNAGDPRAWPRAAHAIVALSSVAPEQGAAALPQFVSSGAWQLRMYAAAAAAQLRDSETLQSLARDADDRVANAALAALDKPTRQPVTIPTRQAAPIAAADLRRLASPRARLTIKNVGTIDLALFTTEAPATVLRFAQLAEEGFYNGRTFDAVVPNARVQSAAHGGAAASGLPFRDEVGLWPHVRGSVGIAGDGRDGGTGDIFIDLVDNPSFDHRYTVFAQVLNGIAVIDRIQEDDVIESIEILP